MKTLIIPESDEQGMRNAAQILRDGGLVAFPTETVYGLGASALLPDAAARIYAAKGRPSDNPLIVHLAKPEDAESYCITCEGYYKLAGAFMPGPLTVIMPKKSVIPYEVTGGLDTVGIRVPSNPTANRLIRYSGLPIAAPSANISGKPSTTTAAHVVADLYGKIDAIIDGGESLIGLESTIVAFEDEKNGIIRMLRPGGITKEMIEELGFTVILDKAVSKKLGESEKPAAPGMKYRHYAPNASVELFDGTPEKITLKLSEFGNIDSAAILCYYEDTALTGFENAYIIGHRADTENTAHRLFAMLRDFDGDGKIKNIYAALPDTAGMGLAIFNRLIKAAGYGVTAL